MNLIVEGIERDKIDFIYFLIRKIKLICLSRLNIKVMNVLNQQLKQIFNNKRFPQVYDIFIGIFSNLKISYIDPDKYIVKINEASKIPFTDIKYITVIRSINQGSLGVMRYPILNNVINEISDHMSDYYDEWLMGG